MADGFPGRSIQFKWNGAAIKGIREKGITCNGEAINVTSDEDGGWRTLLDVSAEDSVDISLSGVTKDEVLAKAYFQGQRTGTATLTYPNGRVIEGTFFLSSYAETGPYNNATTFTATLQSADGALTFTAAP